MRLNNITLPDDLIWVDEFDWLKIQEKREYSVDGSLLIQSGIKKAGRSITLKGDISSAWIDRGVIKALYNLANQNLTMTLTLNDNRQFSVRFDYGNKPIEVKPIVDYSLPTDTDKYEIILRFYEV